MKRKILCALMLMGVLALPMTAQATEVKEEAVAYEEVDVLNGTDMVVLDYMTLSDHRVVTGDLHVYGTLDLNGYNMQVYGNVYAEKDLKVGNGTLTVGGNYRQESGILHVGAGEVNIDGDLQVYGTNVSGEKVTGNGLIEFSTENGSLNVEGDIILDTNERISERPGLGIPLLKGTITVKGDLIQEKTGDGFTPQKLVLAGNEEQTLQLLNNADIKSLKLENPKVKVAGYLNATLGANVNEITLDDGVFETSRLNLNGYKMTIPGDVIVTGDVTVGDGTLKVTGDYMQKTGILSVGAGAANIVGDLLVYGTNVSGEKVTGDGAIHLTGEDSALNVDGDMVLNTTYDLDVHIWTTMLLGTITLKGDLIHEQSGDGFGPAKLIMAGSEEQTLQLLNNANIKSLKLENPKVKVAGYLNATLASSANEITLDDGVFETSRLNLNGYKMTIPGDVIVTGGVTVGDATLKVTGDYMQETGILSVGAGAANIGGDLLVYGTNMSGEKVTGDGAIHLTGEDSALNVDGDMVLNTTYDLDVHIWTTMLLGTITLKGDLIHEQSGDGFGPAKLIMAGSGEQTLQLLNNANIKSLKLENPKVKVAGYLNTTLASSANEITLDDGVFETSRLNLNGYKMTIPGDVIATGGVTVGDATLTVTGDYMQKKGQLYVSKGKANIEGDFQLYSTNVDGEKVTGQGELELADANGKLNIEGNLLLDTSASLTNSQYTNYLKGEIAVKGNLIHENSGDGFNPNHLILAGDKDQTLTLLDNAYIGELKVTNDIKVTVTDYLNATLGSTINVVPKDGVLYSIGMNLNGHTMNVTGKMAGQGDINVGNGTLNVSSDYLQQTGALIVAKGKANIAGDLLVQTINAEGEYATGNGYLKLTDATGNLKIDGNLLLNTSANMSSDLKGKITIAKDLLQVVSGEVNPKFKPSYVYMAGEGAQKVDMASPNAWIDTLELGQEIGNYTFNPEPCWNNLIQMKVQNPFADVQESSWQYSFVKYALDNELMKGKGTDESGNILFDPNNNMTRAEFVQTLYNKEGKPAITFSATFTDVPKGQWYTNAILWAAQNNIVAGKGEAFDVAGKITRQEMATVLFKYANYSEYETEGRKDFAGFVDYDSISGWAINNMKWALHYGIMSGKGDKIDPTGNATRAECATMLRNFIKAYEE